MKSKLFLKASSLVCALALLVTGIHTAFAADRDYTLKKAFTIENAASANAVKLYQVYSNKQLFNNGKLSVDGADVSYSTPQQYDSFLGALTELDGVDLTASDVEIDEWSYKITGNVPASTDDKINMFGYLYNWTKVGSQITKTEDGYTVTDGDTGFQTVNSNIRLDDSGYTYLKMAVTSNIEWDSAIQGANIAVTDDGTTLTANGGSGNHNVVNGIYWLGAPTVEVSYVNNGGGTHKYTVKAVDIYTKSDDVYTKTDDKVLRTFDVTDGSDQDTGLVMLGTGRYLSSSILSSVKFTDIKVKYNKSVDYTAVCEQFLNENPIVEKLYDGTFAPTKDTADALKAQLNTALSQYKEFNEEEKAVFDNNFPSFESKVSAALKECARAAYGKFTADSEVTVTADKITSLETKDYVQFYNNNSVTTNAMFTSSGNTVKYTSNQNYAIGIGEITKINDVDVSADNVAVKEWSYTVTADNSEGAKIGYIKDWDYINDTAVSVTGTISNAKMTGEYSSLNIGVGGWQSGKYGGKAVYDSETSAWTWVDKRENTGFENGFNFYWLGAPKFKVAYTDNNDGTHTYTVYATDIYTLADDVYTKADDVVKVKKDISDNSEAALDFIMVAGGGFGGNNKDIVISDINVKYTIEEDITDECVTVLEAGNGMIDRLDGIVTKANAADVAADVAALKTAYESASAEVKNAIDAKYAGVAAKIAYAEKYAYVAANKASPELKGINIKKVTSASASDLRFAVGYAADGNTDYTVAGYGAVVVLNQALEDKNAELTKDTAVKSGMENYFFDVYEQVTAVPVDNQGQFYVTITGSKGKPGTLIDCRPYVVYTDGDNEFVLYASNDDTDKNISNGQASKCGIFAARDLSNAMNKVLGEKVVYPDGCTKEEYNAIINKIGNTATTSAEKNVVYQFLYENCDAYVKALG